MCRERKSEEEIKNNTKTMKFAVVMCDINDLKNINDTRGHSYGDEEYFGGIILPD
ncbi:MAG: GGDEF domain-containing protein [Eubacterium sp.]|nr:diguanylate cyclase [Eubacterium sp.]MCR5367775.1 GGDEF domain-containing protein [Eubacterium sp.]